MTSILAGVRGPNRPFAPWHPWDRSAVAVGLLAIWAGVLFGFGPEILQHLAAADRPYPLIVHLHAVAFVGWLVLLSVQAGLIRSGRPDLHRRLGLFGMALAAIMVVVGPATAFLVDKAALYRVGSDPAFIIVQFTDIAAFAVLVSAAFLLRGDASAHKRLILIATLYIADAGFSRWLDPYLYPLLGDGFAGDFAESYLGSDLVMLAIGAYDLATRRRLHPVYLPAMAFVFGIEIAAIAVCNSPAWTPIAVKLLLA